MPNKRLELKFNKDAQTAPRQIGLKDYARRFALCGKPVTKVEVNFNSAQGNITDWKIEKKSISPTNQVINADKPRAFYECPPGILALLSI